MLTRQACLFVAVTRRICTVQVWQIWRIAGALLLATFAAVDARGGQPNVLSSNSGGPLKFEARIKLPDYAWRLAWSPDNETIAVTQFNKGELRLIHLKNRGVGEPVLNHFAGSAPIAWSPRNNHLVAVERGRIRLFSTADWSEVGQVRSPHEGCRFQSETPPAFAKDGTYIWVSCAQHNVYSTYTAAIKLEVPSLHITDRLLLDPPVPGKRTGALHDTVKLQGTAIAFSTIIANYDPNKQGYPETPHYTMRVFDLTKRSEISTPINLSQFGWGGGFMIDTPIQGLLAIESGIAAVRGWSKDQQVTTINLATGERLATFASIKDTAFQGLNDLRITSNGSLLIGAIAQLSKNAGGIYVWDARSGRLLQYVSNDPVSWIELSGDERSLAAIVRNELIIYRITSN